MHRLDFERLRQESSIDVPTCPPDTCASMPLVVTHHEDVWIGGSRVLEEGRLNFAQGCAQRYLMLWLESRLRLVVPEEQKSMLLELLFDLSYELVSPDKTLGSKIEILDDSSKRRRQRLGLECCRHSAATMGTCQRATHPWESAIRPSRLLDYKKFMKLRVELECANRQISSTCEQGTILRRKNLSGTYRRYRSRRVVLSK